MRAGIHVRIGPFWIASGGGSPRPPKPPRDKAGPVAWTLAVVGALLLAACVVAFVYSQIGHPDAVQLGIFVGVPALVLIIVLPWRRILHRVFVKD